MRIGQGIDIHRFSEDPHRPLVLGGVVIEGARGLGGHSDADAVCHSLADAVLLWASAASGDYPVLVGRGLLGSGNGHRLAETWPLDRSRSRTFLVSDETVSALAPVVESEETDGDAEAGEAVPAE